MNKKVILIIILLVASLLRLWDLGKVPASPDWDEASLGYNAYSILHTGRDEYGAFLPVILRSFDDYKPALYTYISIPFIALLGLSTFAVRLPSALFGIGAVVLVYLLVKELFKEKDWGKIMGLDTEFLALLSSFLLAISPWHLQFSRIAFESNVGLSLNICTLLFFLKGLRSRNYMIASFIVGAFNIHMYQSEKVFVPLLLTSLIIVYRKEFFSIPKRVLCLCAIISLVVVSPLFYTVITTPNVFLRAKGVSVFSDQNSLLSQNTKRLLIDKQQNNILGYVLDNRRLEYAKAIISGYGSHFDLNWLFIKGDIARHHAPYMGLLYIAELPFLLIGFYVLLFSPLSNKIKFTLLSCVLIAPVPASVTSGVPHAVRTINFLPVIQIISAMGFIGALKVIESVFSSTKVRKTFIVVVIFIFLFNFVYFLDQYFVQLNYFSSQEWQYGYEQAVDFVSHHQEKYGKIIVSNKPYLDQSYVFFLFYLHYPPNIYQKETVGVSGGFKENHTFGKYQFRPIDWATEEKDSKIMLVGQPKDFPPNAHVLKTIYFIDGTEAIKIVER